MPKSKVRRKTAYTPPPNARTPVKVAGPTHPVYVAVMLGLMLLGLAWLVVNYLAGDKIGFMIAIGSCELRHRVRADRRRSADDHAMALSGPPDGDRSSSMRTTSVDSWSLGE
jgi:hypothetical protein